MVKRVLVTVLGSADALSEQVWGKLMELGWLGEKTLVIILGDGAEWLWNRAKLFANRVEILDFWHAIEKAWAFARVRYGEGSELGAQWVKRLSDDLRAGRVEEVLVRLKATSANKEEEKEPLAALVRYYEENKARMKYDEYLEKGYGIGSGAAESAHKQMVQARMRQAGMRWSEEGARRLLALRLRLLNGEWEALDKLRMKSLTA